MPKATLTPANLTFQPRLTCLYSLGAKGGGMIFTAGQVAWDKTGEVMGVGDVRLQTRQTLKNVISVLTEGGAIIDDVLKCNVYLADMGDLHIMNEELSKVFHTNPPARTTIEARLAEPSMLVEIEELPMLN